MSSLITHPELNEQTQQQEQISCLQQKKVAPKFHYETQRQSDLWLRVHKQFAPPAGVSDLYKSVGKSLLKLIKEDALTLVSLGCGGGEKDVSVLKELSLGTKYLPTDLSIPLVRSAANRAKSEDVHVNTLLAFDLLGPTNIRNFIKPHISERNIFTFFGLIPNFHPQEILPTLYSLVEPEDFLLLSANLAPQGIGEILPQYDNQPTKEWLMEFLNRFGKPKGEIKISPEHSGNLDFISAKFIFSDTSNLIAGENQFSFEPLEEIDLFTSYRYTVDSMKSTLAAHRIEVAEEFISQNGEEGVFLCQTQ